MNRKRRLYRNVHDGKIAGVCAGIADYFGFDAWLVRIAVVAAFFMGAGILFPLYLAMWLILDPMPEEMYDGFDVPKKRARKEFKVNIDFDTVDDDSDDYERKQRKSRRNRRYSEQYNSRASDVVSKLDDRFAEMEQRLQQMEGFVTSSKYKLHRAFKDLEK